MEILLTIVGICVGVPLLLVTIEYLFGGPSPFPNPMDWFRGSM